MSQGTSGSKPAISSAQVRTVDVGPVSLSVTTQGAGPAVLLLHGFPEIGYSWRHQLGSLAEAGFSAIAPDQRGFGWSDAPESVDAYAITDLVGDAVALLDALGHDEAIVVGHDWGAIIAAAMANMRPDLVGALCLMSVNYQPRTDQSWVDHLAPAGPDGPFGYMLGFQEAGVEALFDADPQAMLTSMYWAVSAEEQVEGGPVLPSYLSEGDLENYARAFARSGFAGGINYYRNLHRNWELTRPWHHGLLRMPTRFIGGASDFVCDEGNGGLGFTIAESEAFQLDHRGSTLIEGAGHWVQQERPEEVNAALIDFCCSVS